MVSKHAVFLALFPKYAVSSVRWMVLNISLQFSLWILCIQVLREHLSPSMLILHNPGGLGVVPVAWGSGFNLSCVASNDLKGPRPLGLPGPLTYRWWFPKVTPRLRRNSWPSLSFSLVAAASSLPHFILVVTTAPLPPFIPQAPFCTSFRKDLLKVWELQGELVYCRHRQWQPTPALLPRKSHGWRSLVGPSPWGRKESDTTERLLTFTFTSTGQKI